MPTRKVLRSLRGDRCAQMGGVIGIVLIFFILFATVDVMYYPDNNIVTKNLDLTAPSMPDNPDANSSWWSDIPIIGGVFDFASSAWELICDFGAIFASIITFDFTWLNVLLGDFALLIKIPIWFVLGLAIIKILPTT